MTGQSSNIDGFMSPWEAADKIATQLMMGGS